MNPQPQQQNQIIVPIPQAPPRQLRNLPPPNLPSPELIEDVAVKILNDRRELTLNRRLLRDILLLLAMKTDAFLEKKPHIILRIIMSTPHMKP
ncbi:hypothetical protein L2E82_49166 [Cichorium intybus]|uniref:Uncharacterized protein n=1 Tax=Cichorium intybus TaxID=13427 RepID=A0ACB8Z060_CICIN|nr:hypothetical protein L2E82_49166 [Cichorium intybus]